MADAFKYEVAMGTAAKIGNALKQRKKELEQRIIQRKGAQEAALVLSKKIQEYQLIVKQEVDAADIDVEIHKIIARHVTNCALHAEKYAQHQVAEMVDLRGKLGGIDEAITVVDQVFKAEEIGKQRAEELEEESSAPVEPPEVEEPKENGSSPEASPDEIRELMSKHDKAKLILMAGKAGVSSQGSKAAIAKRILEG